MAMRSRSGRTLSALIMSGTLEALPQVGGVDAVGQGWQLLAEQGVALVRHCSPTSASAIAREIRMRGERTNQLTRRKSKLWTYQ